MKVGSRVGPREVPPEPGEDPAENGEAVEERRSKNADVGRGEDEELEDGKGAEEKEK